MTRRKSQLLKADTEKKTKTLKDRQVLKENMNMMREKWKKDLRGNCIAEKYSIINGKFTEY